MPKTKAQKEVIVSELAGDLRQMKGAVFTSIAGFTMPDADGLRTKGREAGVKFSVTKKTLLARALKDVGITVEKDQIEGSVLTAIGLEDEVSAAKIVAAFLKERAAMKREGMKIVGGVMEGKFIDASAVKTLSMLPSKQELLARVVGSINAPVSGFVNVLAGNLRGLVTVLNAVKDKKPA